MNIVPLHFCKDVPRGHFCLEHVLNVFVCANKQMSKKNARNNAHVLGHASSGLFAIVKKTNVYPLTTTSLPTCTENVVWSCRLKAHTFNTYLNTRACHAICSFNPTESRTQTNFQTHVCVKTQEGQTKVNVLMWPTRCLTERAAGPH